MKRNNIQWVLPVAALCLLATSCSKDNNQQEPTAPKTRTLTIDCGIGATDSKTRAGILPGNTDKTKESFIWHEKDEFKSFLIPEGGNNYLSTQPSFLIDENYSNASPSKSASFTCKDFPAESPSYKMLTAYGNGFRITSTPGAFPFTVYSYSQKDKNNTDHLAQSMCMYATSTVTDKANIPNLTFHHLSSLFRFTVTNKNASPCRIFSIRVSSSKGHKIFGTGYTLKVTDWEKGMIETSCTNSLAVLSQRLEDPSDYKIGIELSDVNDTDKNTLEAYASVGQNTNVPLTDQQLIFTIIATNVDGTNEHIYTSLALDANKIIAQNSGATTWEPGKRYWFNLILDNELTVTLNSVTPMPGWDSETDL